MARLRSGAVAVLVLACGPSSTESPPSGSSPASGAPVAPAPRPTSVATGPTVLGHTTANARAWQEWRGPGRLFEGVHGSVRQVRVTQGEETKFCRFSPSLSTVRCAVVPRSADLATHRAVNAWYAAEPGHYEGPGATMLDLLRGGAIYEGQKSASGTMASVDVDGSVRWFDGLELLRGGSWGLAVVPRQRETYPGLKFGDVSLVGPWEVLQLVYESMFPDPQIVRALASFVHPLGGEGVGAPIALGNHVAFEGRKPMGCWDHGHTGVLFTGSVVLLEDRPDSPVRSMRSKVRKELAIGGRIEVICTERGLISSASRRTDADVVLRVEERCEGDACVHREIELPGQSWVTAPLGAASLAVGVTEEHIVARIAPFEDLPRAEDRPLVARSMLPVSEEPPSVEVLSNGTEAVVFILVSKGPRIESAPGPGQQFEVSVLRVAGDGTVSFIPLEE